MVLLKDGGFGFHFHVFAGFKDMNHLQRLWLYSSPQTSDAGVSKRSHQVCFGLIFMLEHRTVVPPLEGPWSCLLLTKHTYGVGKQKNLAHPKDANLCPGCQEGQWHPGVHQEECGQQVEGGSPLPLLCPGEAPSAVLGPVLGSPVQER